MGELLAGSSQASNRDREYVSDLCKCPDHGFDRLGLEDQSVQRLSPKALIHFLTSIAQQPIRDLRTYHAI